MRRKNLPASFLSTTLFSQNKLYDDMFMNIILLATYLFLLYSSLFRRFYVFAFFILVFFLGAAVFFYSGLGNSLGSLGFYGRYHSEER